jgi:hypothetical protein
VTDYTTSLEPLTPAQNALLVGVPGVQVPLTGWSGAQITPTIKNWSVSFYRHSMVFVRLSIQNQIQKIEQEKADDHCSNIDYKPQPLQQIVSGTRLNGVGVPVTQAPNQ